MLITLWTIRHRSEYNKFLRDGVLLADEKRVDSYNVPAYQWISAQLAKKTNPPKQCRFPLWAWYQWQGEKRATPDLRSSSHLAKGTSGVRIEFTIPSSDVLLSDFDAWHSVLNNHFYAPTDKRYNDYCEMIKGKSDAEINKIIENSWHNIFDLNLSNDPDNVSIQANFWELKSSQIVNVTFFTAR